MFDKVNWEILGERINTVRDYLLAQTRTGKHPATVLIALAELAFPNRDFVLRIDYDGEADPKLERTDFRDILDLASRETAFDLLRASEEEDDDDEEDEEEEEEDDYEPEYYEGLRVWFDCEELLDPNPEHPKGFYECEVTHVDEENEFCHLACVHDRSIIFDTVEFHDSRFEECHAL